MYFHLLPLLDSDRTLQRSVSICGTIDSTKYYHHQQHEEEEVATSLTLDLLPPPSSQSHLIPCKIFLTAPAESHSFIMRLHRTKSRSKYAGNIGNRNMELPIKEPNATRSCPLSIVSIYFEEKDQFFHIILFIYSHQR